MPEAATFMTGVVRAFRGPDHNLHDLRVAESVPDICRLEAAKLPQFGAFSRHAGQLLRLLISLAENFIENFVLQS
jgi:hypothetical protein